jgi:hypothetical protein
MSLYNTFIYDEETVYGQSLSFNDYLAVLQSSNRKSRIKVELLYLTQNGYEVYEEITQNISNTSGSLTVDFKNGQRRQVSLIINDPIRKYNISPLSLWINKYFRVYKGFQIGNDYIWFLQGTFVLNNPNVLSNFSQRTIELNGLDKMSLLDNTLGGTLCTTYQMLVDTEMRNGIEGILNEVGDLSPLVYDSGFEGYTIPYTITRDDTYFNILEELANLRSANVFYDVYGNLNFVSGIEDLDDSIKPSLYSFKKDGTDLNYLTGQVKYDFENIKNSVYVVGATVDGEIFNANAKDTNLESPTRISLIGEKILSITDDNINTTQYAQDRSNYELKNNKILYISVTITCLPILNLDVNCVVDLTDKDLEFNEQRLLIQSIEDPYTDGQNMTIVCSGVNELAFSNI